MRETESAQQRAYRDEYGRLRRRVAELTRAVERQAPASLQFTAVLEELCTAANLLCAEAEVMPTKGDTQPWNDQKAVAVAAHLFYDTRPADATGVRTAGWRVTCVVDPNLWLTTVDPLAVRWQPLLDYGDPGHIADVAAAGRAVLVRATQSVIALDRVEQFVVIVAPTPAGAFVESYKTVRHLLTTQLLAHDATPLHASAVSVDGNVLAFCGRKGSGKSSGLLHALLSRVPGLGYVANDQLLLRLLRRDQARPSPVTLAWCRSRDGCASTAATTRWARRRRRDRGGPGGWRPRSGGPRSR